MRTRRTILCVTLPLLLVGLAGCQRLNHEKTYSVAPLEVQAVSIDAPKVDQKVTVDVKAAPAPVNVYVVLDDKLAAVKTKLLGSKKLDPSDTIVGKEKAESEILEATIPAGKAFSVILSGAGKKTEVKLKIKG